MATKTNIRGYYPSVVQGPSGVAHWAYEFNYHIWYTKQNADGTFANPKNISGKLPYAEVPTISLRAGKLLVVFQSYDKPKQEYSLCYVSSTDDGVTWK